MQKILVLDFGGQYNQLIARRVRDLHVYAEIEQFDAITPEERSRRGYKGIIFTGGPNSVYDPESPHYDPKVLELGIPVLGICYGAQLTSWMAGGSVVTALRLRLPPTTALLRLWKTRRKSCTPFSSIRRLHTAGTATRC